MKKPTLRGRRSKWISLAVILAASIWWFFQQEQPSRSARDAAALLQNELRTGAKPPGAQVRVNGRTVWHVNFPDGSWCLGLMNSKSAGDAESWALLVHSTREVLSTPHSFAGHEEWAGKLQRLPTRSWTAFSDAARAQYGFQPMPR